MDSARLEALDVSSKAKNAQKASAELLIVDLCLILAFAYVD